MHIEISAWMPVPRQDSENPRSQSEYYTKWDYAKLDGKRNSTAKRKQNGVNMCQLFT